MALEFELVILPRSMFIFKSRLASRDFLSCTVAPLSGSRILILNPGGRVSLKS